MPKKVLLVEDEQEIADVLSLHLRDVDALITHAVDGVRGLTLALQDHWDLIMLDISLPRMDGLTICKQVREFNPSTPIILVTARDSEVERVAGLDSGADDYITKPFSVSELVARVRAIFRRCELDSATKPQDVYCVSDIVLCPVTRSVTVGGNGVNLTAKEFDLLLHFCKAPDRVFSRKELLETVWGYQHTGYLHTVNSHINRLRAKIETKSTDPVYIKTVWGIGYKLVSARCLEGSECVGK